MRLERLDILNTIKEGGQRVYSPNNKPSAVDVGARPVSWKPTWNDVQSKPSQATRWPSWSEVTGKPSGIINQSALDGRYLLKTAKAVDSDKLDGRDSSQFVKLDNKSGTMNSGNWYKIASGVSRSSAEFIITEGVSGKHGYARFQAGISYGGQPYINLIASNGYSGGNGILRYVRIVDADTNVTYGRKSLEVYVDGTGTVTAHMSYDIGTHASWSLVDFAVTSGTVKERVRVDLDTTTAFMSTNHMYSGGGKVYSTTNKPTAADVGTYSKSESDGKFALKTQSYSKAETDGKYQPKNAKLDRFNASLMDTNSGQDFLIRGKRALVGMDTEAKGGLVINYSNDFGKVSVKSDLEVSGEIRTPRVEAGYDHGVSNSIGCSNWFRSSGKTGWFNGTYKGGIYMADSTWVRTYGTKKFHVDNTGTDAIYTLGGVKANKGFFWGSQSLDSRYLKTTNKTSSLGASSDWDKIGWGNSTTLKLQGHKQFWLGAGNGTWFLGAANKKGSNVGGISSDVSNAHDLLVTTMVSSGSTDRGITFGVATDGNANKGYRLGKWHSSNTAAGSLLAIDGTLFAKGGRTDEYDYYGDDYSKYYTTGTASWGGDGGWHKPSIVSSSALQIQSGNKGTNTRKPQLQFHQYGYGGPILEYDGPGKTFTIKDTGSGIRLSADGFKFKTFKVYHEGHKPTADEVGALGKTAKAADSNLIDGVDSSRIPFGSNDSACTKTSDFNNNTKSGFIESNKAKNQPGTNSSWTWGIQTNHTGGGKYGAQFVISQDGKAYFRVQNSSGAGTWRTFYSNNNKPTATDVGALAKTAKAVDSSKLEGKTKAQVIAEARSGLDTSSTAANKFLAKTAKAVDSDKLDGQDSPYFRSGMKNEVKIITVGGDSDVYYPVRFSSNADNGYAWRHWHIARSYSATAPITWNTPSHKGGLTLDVEWSGDGAWGGNDHNIRVTEFKENYTTMVGGLVLSTGGLIVWLRGGGAKYYITGPNGVSTSVTVHLTDYKAPDKKIFAPRAYESDVVKNEVWKKHCLRGNGNVYDDGERVYSPKNKPTAADLGAITKSQSDGYYLGKTAKATTAVTSDKVKVSTSPSTGWYGMVWNSGTALYNTDRAGKGIWKYRPSDGYMDITKGTIRLRDNNKLNFGTASDANMFCDGSHLYLDLQSGINNFYIRDGGTNRFTFDDAGDFTATGNVSAYSDARLKTDVKVIPDALDKVVSLRGCTYIKGSGLDKKVKGYFETKETGLIAQEVEKVLPEAVSVDKHDKDGIKAVAYGNMAGLFVEAIKELKIEVDLLKNKVKELEGDN